MVKNYQFSVPILRTVYFYYYIYIFKLYLNIFTISVVLGNRVIFNKIYQQKEACAF